MSKTISAEGSTEPLGAVYDWVRENQEAIILESDGQPGAAILPYDEYAELQQLKERERIRAAFAEYARQAEAYRREHPLPPPKLPLSQAEGEALWAELEALRMRVSARNADLTEEEIEAIAIEVGREARRAWAEKLRAGPYGND